MKTFLIILGVVVVPAGILAALYFFVFKGKVSLPAAAAAPAPGAAPAAGVQGVLGQVAAGASAVGQVANGLGSAINAFSSL